MWMGCPRRRAAPSTWPSSAPQPVTVSNQGDDDLRVTSISVPGANAEDYRVTGFSGATVLRPDQFLQVEVAFRPQQVGAQDAQLVVQTNSPVPPASDQVQLRGTGTGAVGIALSSTALVFGVVDVQADPVTGSVTVSNQGNLTLTIQAIRLEQLSGTPYTGDAYRVLTEAPFSVGAGGTRGIEVVYEPAVESDSDLAVMVLQTNAPGGEVEISLSGRGSDRHIQVTPPAVDFPPTYRNPSEAAEVVLNVENTGDSRLALADVVLDGDAADSSAIVGDLGDGIAPRASASVVVQFLPRAAPADHDASLLLVNDDDDRPMVRVDLRGTSILPPIAPTHETIDWGSVAVGLDLPAPGGRSSPTATEP